MKQICELGVARSTPLNKKNEWKDIFVTKMENNIVFFQDLFHIISKIRTRLLETSSPMNIGSHKISLATLRVRLRSLHGEYFNLNNFLNLVFDKRSSRLKKLCKTI